MLKFRPSRLLRVLKPVPLAAWGVLPFLVVIGILSACDAVADSNQRILTGTCGQANARTHPHSQGHPSPDAVTEGDPCIGS